MDTKPLIRGLCLASVLIAGSCAGLHNDGSDMLEDPQANHPIHVEPSYQSLRLYYSPADAGGIQPADQARFRNFVADYQAHGNGAIAIGAPAGINSQATIGFFAQRINEMGVSKDHILVASHDAPDGDMRVEINYVSYQAHTDKCGDWSQNLSYTADNLTSRNFGCSVQQNIAAQIADPRDLLGPRMQDDADAVRRGTVTGKYELGLVTSAAKTPDQKVSSSGVGN